MAESLPHSKVALGITGGIAAYKSAALARLLVTAGYEVFPIMTPWATRFAGPLTFEAICRHKVRVETPAAGDPDSIEHIALVRQADLLVIAPLTANTMAKMANGLADNFLTNAYLAHTGLTLACPAMNTAMLSHPASQRNLAKLQDDGVHLLHGTSGDLACGEVGAGRMAEPEVIFDKIVQLTSPKVAGIEGKQVLISAGPTCEDLDPVRFLTNRSSGKMGIALAKALRNAGAKVTLVHGPVSLALPSGMETVSVRTAADMASAMFDRQASADIVIMAAAVADYRPEKHSQKLKKGSFDGVLHLQRTTDILAELGKRKTGHQHLIGFAAESQHLLANAQRKLEAKNLSIIFANPIDEEDSGFGVDQNQVVAISRSGKTTDLGRQSKANLAVSMVKLMAETLFP